MLYEAGHTSPDPNEAVRWEYDGEGRMVLEEYDAGYDGAIEYFHTWSYDGDGHLVERYYHEDFEMEPEYARTITYTWVADRITEIEWHGESEDWGTSHLLVHLQSEDGLPSRYDMDENADGTLDSVIGYSWDGPDRLLVQWSDEDADGIIDERYELLYDGADLPHHIDVTMTAPGENPGEMDFLWNAEGKVLDFQGIGLPGYGGENGQHIIQEYDEDGRLIYYCEDDLTVECDENQRSYTYDGDLIALEEIWIGGDEQQEERVEYEWSCP